MSLRNKIKSAMKEAMKEKAQLRLSTLRLISAAIKDRDIAARSEGVEDGVDETEILAILGKMTRQRQESAKTLRRSGQTRFVRTRNIRNTGNRILFAPPIK